MTKEEAIMALAEGKRVTHVLFCEDEWMEQIPGQHYRFEDGCKCPSRLFWQDRKGPYWAKGWSIVEKDQTTKK